MDDQEKRPELSELCVHVLTTLVDFAPAPFNVGGVVRALMARDDLVVKPAWESGGIAGALTYLQKHRLVEESRPNGWRATFLGARVLGEVEQERKTLGAANWGAGGDTLCLLPNHKHANRFEEAVCALREQRDNHARTLVRAMVDPAEFDGAAVVDAAESLLGHFSNGDDLDQDFQQLARLMRPYVVSP